MKMRCILALCGAMAFVLAGCGSEIVESAVTETQVIDVNEPSAVERAESEAGAEFVDETALVLEKAEAYCENLGKEKIRKEANKVYSAIRKENESALFYAHFIGMQVVNEQPEVALPDKTCISANEIAARTEKLMNLLNPQVEKQDYTIYLICEYNGHGPEEERTRLEWRANVVRNGEKENLFDSERLLEVCYDSITGEMTFFRNDTVQPEEKRTDSENQMEDAKQILQKILDTAGAGQICTDLQKTESQELCFSGKVNGDTWQFDMNFDGQPYCGTRVYNFQKLLGENE